jgi:preprotein translocase subunit SecB
MQPSQLRLETYHFTKVMVAPRQDAKMTPAGRYADFNNVEFESEVSIGELDNADEPDRHKTLALKLSVHPSANSSFPYDIEVGAVGIFDVSEVVSDKRDVMLLVNGSSMLYGALREALLTLTFRCSHGPVMLPSVNFVLLEKQYLAEKDAKAIAESADHRAVQPT